jgi:hydrogenase expression/formation protein HypE
MPDVGKVPREILAREVLDRLGATREDVLLGPQHGADFGVIDLGTDVLAIATDPLFVPRELGMERAAWYGFHVGVADVALSGFQPAHLAISLSLPPTATEDDLGSVWGVFHDEARTLDAAITTGHTGRYEGCNWPYIGGVTALALGEPADLVQPTGARPGDVLIVTKGPAIETVGVLAVRYGDRLPVSDAVLDAARERFDEIALVEDAQVAAATGFVTAMHDATERGVDNALHELAAASGTRLSVDRSNFPMGPGVDAVCTALDIDPWRASSEGTIIMSVDPDGVQEVLDALAGVGCRAAEVGTVEEGTGVLVDGEPLAAPETDPFWAAYTDLASNE